MIKPKIDNKHQKLVDLRGQLMEAAIAAIPVTVTLPLFSIKNPGQKMSMALI